MGIKLLLIALLGACSLQTSAAECENGWTAFKDETCVKIFPDFLTYPEARMFCTTQGNNESTSTLVMIKDPSMQEFVAELTKGHFDSFWIGGKSDIEAARFKWEDGQSVQFTNWAAGHPRNITNAEVCIQLNPVNTKRARNYGGKWEDKPCQKRNLALCQRGSRWNLEDAVREILNLRRKLDANSNDLQRVTQDLETTKQELKIEVDAVKQNLVPVGSIYVEYYNQPSPTTLWPSITWQDVTSEYEGLFFRAQGANSEEWGATQDECAPRVSQVEYEISHGNDLTISLPKSGWSPWGAIGYHSSASTRENFRFYVEDCEIRPRNQAIRIWKRVA